MGFLSINRNLLSKSKPFSLSSFSFSSDLCFFRRIISRAAVNPQKAHVPSVVGDMKPNSKFMFLIDHVHKGITNYPALLFSAAAENHNNSWKDPFSGLPGKYCLVGSCKEWTLFCPDDEDVDEEPNLCGVDYDGSLFHQSQRRFSMWNPTTKRLVTLPPSSCPRPRPVLSIDIECFGFGFDYKSQDYKLICFLEYLYMSASDSYGEVHIELYSLKTNSWKQITTEPPFVPKSFFSYNCLHINGVFYWGNGDILSFDFADEKFSHISLPYEISALSYFEMLRITYCLAEFHDSLAVISPYWVPDEDLTEKEKKKQLQQPFSIKIWVWNGETWNVGPRVAVGDFPVGDKIAGVLGLFQNEYLFLQGFKEAELMLFNCKTGNLEKLGIHHGPPESPTSAKPSFFPYTVPI